LSVYILIVDDEPDAIERGAEGLLTKPIDFALLRNEIDAKLGQAA
jgi:CheY-like chemotaxis protein